MVNQPPYLTAADIRYLRQLGCVILLMCQENADRLAELGVPRIPVVPVVGVSRDHN